MSASKMSNGQVLPGTGVRWVGDKVVPRGRVELRWWCWQSGGTNLRYRDSSPPPLRHLIHALRHARRLSVTSIDNGTVRENLRVPQQKSRRLQTFYM